MKDKMINIIIVVLLFPLLGGCASMMSHGFVPADSTDPHKSMVTPLFPGTVADVGLVGVALASPFAPEKMHEPRWFIVATPFILLDIPLSLVADIIFLPHDLGDISAWRKSKKKTPVHEFPSDARLDEIEKEMLKTSEQKANKAIDGTSQ